MEDKNLNIGVYCITNKINGKKYIGQSINVKERWKDHIHDANRDHTNKKYNKKFALQSAIAKYGQDNFTWEIIGEYNSFDESNDAETMFIKQFNTISPNGYNLNEGGGSSSPCQEVRDKISETLKKTSFFVGKKGSLHPNFGTKLSEERKLHQSKIFSGDNGAGKKISSEIAVKIYKEYLENENIFATDLAKKYNLGKNTICNILNKKSWKEALKDLPTIDLTIRTNGEKWKKSKLTENEVINIFKEYTIGNVSMQFIADKYNVTNSVISNIINGKSWKHLKLVS